MRHKIKTLWVTVFINLITKKTLSVSKILFANTPHLKDVLQLFKICVLTFCINFPTEISLPKRHVMILNKIGALRQQQMSSVEVVIVMKS